jgi:hypothetical protein
MEDVDVAEDSDLVVDDGSSDEDDGLSPSSEARHKKRKPGERGGGKVSKHQLGKFRRCFLLILCTKLNFTVPKIDRSCSSLKITFFIINN